MPYLDRLARDYVVTRIRDSRPELSVSDFQDRTDRTLLLGKNDDGTMLHVYIQRGVLYAHKYYADREDIDGACFAGEIDTQYLVTDLYTIPRTVDAELAELLIARYAPLRLADWDSEDNKVEDSDTGYYGRVWATIALRKPEEKKTVIVDFTPIPWPDEIQDRFAEYSAIAWVPRFLHEEITHWTEYISDVDPDFRYQDIMILSDGTFSVRFKDQDSYGANSFMESLREQMADALTDAYRSAANL